MQYRGPPGYPVLQAATSRQLERPSPRVDDGGRLSASHTTARATATAAGRSADGADRRPSRPGGAAATAGPARATAAGWSAAKIATVPGSGWGSVNGCRYSLAPLPESDDSSPSLPGNSGNGALANVAFDWTLRDNVPSVFRQSPETAKDARHQPPALYEVRHAVTNTGPDRRRPGPTIPRAPRDQVSDHRSFRGQMTRSAVLTHKALLRRAGPRGLIGIAAMTGASMTSPLRTPC